MICCTSWFFKILNIVFCDLYTQRTMVQTIKPNTTRWEREAVSSTRNPRNQLVNFFTKLRDEDNIVCNENWIIIYIYADEWEPILMTQWQDR